MGSRFYASSRTWRLWPALCQLLSLEILRSLRLRPVPHMVLFEYVRIFDGRTGALSPPSNVLVPGNRIEKISTSPIAAERNANTTIIRGVVAKGLVSHRSRRISRTTACGVRKLSFRNRQRVA